MLSVRVLPGLAVTLILAALQGPVLAAQLESAPIFLNAQMPWHSVVLDGQGRLLAWYHPEKNLGYDQFLRLDWDFLEHRFLLMRAPGSKSI